MAILMALSSLVRSWATSYLRLRKAYRSTLS